MSTFDRRLTVVEMEPYRERAQATFEQGVDTPFAATYVAEVEAHPMGSYRRAWDGEDTLIGDLDLLVTTPNDGIGGMKDLTLPDWLTVTEKKAHGWMLDGAGRVMIDAWWCPWASVGPFALFLTGDAEFNVWMRQTTNRLRPELMLTQYGLFKSVLKPTKTYPNRRVVGARVDFATVGSTVEQAEQLFWSQWCDQMGLIAAWPSPSARDGGWRRLG